MANTSARIPSSAKNIDNTHRKYQSDYQAPVYTATIAVVTKANCKDTLIKVGQLTGALTLTCATDTNFVGDTMTFLFTCDATARTITYSTGFGYVTATQVLVASKSASSTWMWNGAIWVEVCRSIATA
tara:strand:+ start:42 stop:425 length:384 start_codon:yes stop_codon:yes gene_type:complete